MNLSSDANVNANVDADDNTSLHAQDAINDDITSSFSKTMPSNIGPKTEYCIVKI